MFDASKAAPHSIEEMPPAIVAPEDLVEELASAFAQRDRHDARVADLLRQVWETQAFSRDGYSSLSALLKHRMSLHPGEAQRLVARANGLADTPLVALAYARGAISGARRHPARDEIDGIRSLRRC